MRYKWKLGSLHAILTESDIKVVINLILLSLRTLAFLNINALHLLYNQTYVVGSIFGWFVRKEKVSNLMQSYDHRKLKRFLVGDDTAGLITNDEIFPSRRFTKSSTFNVRKSSQSLHKNLMPHLIVWGWLQRQNRWKAQPPQLLQGYQIFNDFRPVRNGSVTFKYLLNTITDKF